MDTGADQYRYEATTNSRGFDLVVTINQERRYCIELIATHNGDVRERFLTDDALLSLIAISLLSAAKNPHDYALHLRENFYGDPIREHVDLDKPITGRTPFCAGEIGAIGVYDNAMAALAAKGNDKP